MTSIVYIIPYFGTFPPLFRVWLESCKRNPSVTWLIFTDDETPYDYPDNVHVEICSFDEIRAKISAAFTFPVNLPSPYKLCDYKVAYGILFADYIKDYDYWGYCDIDLIWGNIRAFYTEYVFSKFEKIGYQGHSTLFRNNQYINNLFFEEVDGETFESLVKSDKNEFIDEDFINRLFEAKGIQIYKEPVFANLSPLVHNFKINHLRAKDKSKNKYFIFIYEDGNLERLAVVGNKIYSDSFLYVHFLKREIDVKIKPDSNKYLIVPNKLIIYEVPTVNFIKKANQPHAIRFAIRHFRENAYKLNIHTICPILWQKLKGYYRLFVKC